jgi:hypothetical protein
VLALSTSPSIFMKNAFSLPVPSSRLLCIAIQRLFRVEEEEKRSRQNN